MKPFTEGKGERTGVRKRIAHFENKVRTNRLLLRAADVTVSHNFFGRQHFDGEGKNHGERSIIHLDVVQL